MLRTVTLLFVFLILFSACSKRSPTSSSDAMNMGENNLTESTADLKTVHELQIENMRKRDYPGSAIIVEQKLSDGSNYTRQVVSYRSEGLKIFALMTIPKGEKPSTGWPVIVFNHGYIPPAQYRTTEKYVAYQDAFARAGYITFKSDYRGHGSSEGEAVGGYGSPGYTIDVLNAVAALKAYPDADRARLGMWGHSMGGYITLRAMVIDPEIKTGVIWAGVVGSYPDLLTNWRLRSASPPPLPSGARRWREVLTQEFGTPENNPDFWNSISANSYLQDLSGPIQIQHGSADTSVPLEFSVTLEKQLKAAGKGVELYVYEGDDHNLSLNLRTALNRSVEFFDTHLR